MIHLGEIDGRPAFGHLGHCDHECTSPASAPRPIWPAASSRCWPSYLMGGDAPRWLICDDHPLVLGAMAQTILHRWPDVIIDRAGSFDEAEALCELDPALVLTDLAMPGATPLNGIARIRRRLPNARIIVLTGLIDDDLLLSLVNLPVEGFISKAESGAVVQAAIELVVAGGHYFPPRIAQLASNIARTGPASASRITPRQHEVIKLLASGHSNKEIAKLLGLSPATVKTHVAQVMANVGANNRAEAAARAVALGLT
ncbi:response regulator transcription factor [Novosphingobium ginsenosidimutans]|uniref:Response regulator transcription factor n=2 Tax=Novosphingobium ginsenosidimutans TaxID=1176536 RepID=A0A5B8S668_9SPHN|nr:response regulator transcription factor [Novosphingobium ginsenosidimutans]